MHRFYQVMVMEWEFSWFLSKDGDIEMILHSCFKNLLLGYIFKNMQNGVGRTK